MFSKKEITDLTISVLALTLIFSSFEFEMFLSTLFIVIFAFFSHEMAHKFLAMHYGFSAEYRMWKWGIILGLAMSFFGGFAFVAPGAVYTSPYKQKFAFKIARVTRNQHGMINFIGPMINIVVGLVMVALNLIFPFGLFIVTARVSFFLAMFNLIPFPPLDGSKVMGWNKKIWAVAFAASLIGLFL
ncbi:MAG: site-2 protease family protein [Candidatus Aenigmarchaeota archaeon]|nr:site-2 protease family protein [Candidatus Aenigmarchaeota archaeon]